MIDSTAAIVLAGGRSSRLASAGIVPPGGKAGLVLAGTTLLERVCGRVGRVARRIVVVAAPGQELPSLPSAVEVVRDSAPGTGPLAGIADGLRAVGGEAAAVLVVSCDVPLVSPQVLGVLREGLLGGAGAPLWVVPEVGGHLQVLLSALRPAALEAIDAHLAAGRRDPRSLLESLAQAGRAIVIPEEKFHPIDPGLQSFRDLDTPRDLEDLGDLLAIEGGKLTYGKPGGHSYTPPHGDAKHPRA
jgi:molybdopterin-guanine dinucleotide biosynthesis protein A